MKRLGIVLTALAVFLAASPAFADTVTKSTKGFQSVSKGVFEIGFENMLLFTQKTTEPTETSEIATSDLSYMAGLTPRYFVIPNLAVGLNANFFLRKASTTVKVEGQDDVEETTDDSGFLGFLVTNYYIRTGHSFFFKPGIGLGYFTGTRETPGVDANTINTTKLSGLAGKLDLGVAFYPSRNMNLKAGVDLIYRSGEEALEAEGDAAEPDPTPFSSLEAGFNVGIAYVF